MLYVFKIIKKKIKYSPKREGGSSRLRNDNAAGNFGNTMLCPNCWTTRGALPQSILDNWAVSQELRYAVLKGRVDSRARSQVVDVQTQMQSFNFFFWNTTGKFGFEAYTFFFISNSIFWVNVGLLSKFTFSKLKFA